MLLSQEQGLRQTSTPAVILPDCTVSTSSNNINVSIAGQYCCLLFDRAGNHLVTSNFNNMRYSTTLYISNSTASLPFCFMGHYNKITVFSLVSTRSARSYCQPTCPIVLEAGVSHQRSKGFSHHSSKGKVWRGYQVWFVRRKVSQILEQ